MNPNLFVALTGLPRAGKGTIADHLTLMHGFKNFAVGTPLYEEVAAAFRVDLGVLYDTVTKDAPHPELSLGHCRDLDFVRRMISLGHSDLLVPRSPRWLLRMWGTEYRRADDPVYWISKLADRIEFQPGPIVVNDFRVYDLKGMQILAQSRGNDFVVIEAVRPGYEQPEALHSSDLPMPPGVINLRVVNHEGHPGLMVRQVLTYLFSR